MSGRDAQRGFIYQSIIAMVECLDRDDWDEVKLEPDTDNDKVDIQLYKDGVILSSIQVKSSKNQFERNDVIKWMKELKKNAIGSREVSLCLVGDLFSKAFYQDHNLSSNPEIKRFPFSTLKENCKVKLQEYIAYVGYDSQVDDDELNIAYNNFFAEIHNNSISDDTLTREDLKLLLKRVLSIPKCLTQIPGINRIVGVVGRDDIIFDSRCKLDQGRCTVLINGPDGIGKTTIMRCICNSIKDDGNMSNHVAWIRCGKSLRDDILLLRDAFGISDIDDDATAYNQIIEKMKRFEGILYLFMDNIERKPDSEEINVLNSLHPTVRIMMTSKHRIEGIPVIKLKTLDSFSAVEMFYKYYGRNLEQRYFQVIEEIVDMVHYYPLLVELLARAARRLGGTLEDFNMELKTKGLVDVFQRTYITDYVDNITIEEIVRAFNEFYREQQD